MSTPKASTPYKRFEELAKRLIHVPKKEVDKKEAECEKRNGKKAS